MTILQSLLLGVLEGLTEFLPVSSTAHLLLASEALGIPQTEAQKSFAIAIQLGAILAVVVLYGAPLLRDRRTLFLTLAAFVPTGIVGFFLHRLIKDVLFESVPTILWSLSIGGAVLILFSLLYKEDAFAKNDVRRISYLQAVLIGACQSVSVIPGVSRAAATIIGGQMLGISRKTIVEFSFLLAIPTMAAATGYDLFQSGPAFTAGEWKTLGVGFVVSFITALLSIRWFLSYVKRHSFVAFGVYRIFLAAFVAVFWFIG